MAEPHSAEQPTPLDTDQGESQGEASQAPIVESKKFRLNLTAGGNYLSQSAALAAGAVGLSLSAYDLLSLWSKPMSHLPIAAVVGIGVMGLGLKLFPAETQAERKRKMWVGGSALAVGATLTAGATGLCGIPYGLGWLGVAKATHKALQYTTLALPMTWIGGLAAGAIADSGRSYIKKGKKPVSLKPGEVHPSNLILGHKASDPDEPMVLLESDRYMHMIVVGPTGSGKTATALSPMIVQDLANPDVGATVVEPKGDWILGVPGERDGIKQWGEKLGRTVYVIDPDNPDTDVYNPMYGDMHMVAESITLALRSLFETKASFFADVQEALLKHVIYLLKWLKGDNVTFRDLHKVIGDYALILSYSRDLAMRYSYWENQGFPAHLTEDDREELLKLVEWFRRETTGDAGVKLKEVTLGVRVQLDNMMANKYFRRCIIPDSQPSGNSVGRRVLDLDRHLANNSILCVSTNDGLLAGMSQVLGKLILTALQHAASRRFKQSLEKRRPHTVYVDEAPTYLTETWADFQAKARGFNISIVLALQTIYQFEKIAKGFTQTIVGNSRTRILYGGLPREDVEYWMGAFGTKEEEEVSRSTNERTASVEGAGDLLLYPFGAPKQFGSGESKKIVDKDLLTFNDLYWMERGHVMVQMVQNGNVQKPVRVTVDIVRQLPERMPGNVVSPEAGLAIYADPPLADPSTHPKDDTDTGGKGPGGSNDVDKDGKPIGKGRYTEGDAHRDAEAARRGDPKAKSVMGKIGTVDAPPKREEPPAAPSVEADPPAEVAPPPSHTEPEDEQPFGVEDPATPTLEAPPELSPIQTPPQRETVKVRDNVRAIRPDVKVPTPEEVVEQGEADDDRPFGDEAPKGRPLPQPRTPLGLTGLDSPPNSTQPRISTGNDYPKNPS